MEDREATFDSLVSDLSNDTTLTFEDDQWLESGKNQEGMYDISLLISDNNDNDSLPSTH